MKESIDSFSIASCRRLVASAKKETWGPDAQAFWDKLAGLLDRHPDAEKIVITHREVPITARFSIGVILKKPAPTIAP